MTMKKSAIFIPVAIILAIMLSSGNVLASKGGKQPRECEKKFSELDSSHKGYLGRQDFQRELEGPPGHRKIQRYGKVVAAFSSADKNGDGIVTLGEFCEWQSHRK